MCLYSDLVNFYFKRPGTMPQQMLGAVISVHSDSQRS